MKPGPASLPADDAAFAAARDLARLGYWRLDAATGALLWSEEVFRIYGLDPAAGQPTLETALACHPPGARVRLRQGLRAAGETGRDVSLAAPLTRSDGSRRDVVLRFRAGRCETTGRATVWGCIIDLADAQISDPSPAAHRDGLTGLPDRFGFHERLEAEFERCARDGTTLAVLCLDLDRFKGVNDTLGQAAGDGLLRLVAGRLRAVLPKHAVAARLGGDDFAAILPDTSEQAAIALAQRLLEAVQAPVEIGSRPVAIGVSIGIALAPRDGTDPSALLKAADVALFGAKEQARDGWRVFSPGAGAAETARRGLEFHLRGALARGEFALFYQPIVALPERRPAGYEALLRWSLPGHGPVSPETFIPVAEETRLIVPIGEWVLERACRDAARWPSEIRLSVNVSPVQLADSRFPATLAAILDRTGLAPDRLVLELTETALLDLPENLNNVLEPLRARGLRLALDDFGTGYAAWSYLRSGVFDLLKIDASFPARLHEPGTATILATLLELARRLGIDTVVEGIETEAQLAHVAAEGCRLVQGHLTGAAKPASDLFAAG